MLRRQVKPLHVVLAIVIVVAIAAGVGWKLSFGKKPEPMDRVPNRMMGGPGMRGAPSGEPDGGTPHASPSPPQGN